MDTPASRPSDEWREAQPRCLDCGYDLSAHPDAGLCPECGGRYSKDAIAVCRGLPSALGLAVKFGWPVVLFAAVTLYLPVANDEELMMTLFCGGPIALIALLINTCVVAYKTLRRLDSTPLSFMTPVAERMSVLRMLVIVGIIAAILGPALCFGVCVQRMN